MPLKNDKETGQTSDIAGSKTSICVRFCGVVVDLQFTTSKVRAGILGQHRAIDNTGIFNQEKYCGASSRSRYAKSKALGAFSEYTDC